ncbi:BTAD domain-containing putative transcriptional regulator [Streptomyces thermolineatus]|uniref:BTAD domain-containing putative transcriptional regulator n=1 Tax=Streptomyces thermolineatus TaxID=44033 RepID=A0ABN3L2U0_9ACTN
MCLYLLGPLELRDRGGRSVPVGGRRVAMLLARLALSPSEVVPVGTLIDDLWEDEPPAAGGLNALQRLVSRARRTLHEFGGDEAGRALASGLGGYALNVPVQDVDVHRFEHLAAAGRRLLQRRSPEPAAQVLREALGLWRGAPLAEFAGTGFAARAATRLEEIRLSAVEDRAEAELELGRAGEVLAELHALSDAHPLRERLAGLTMRALDASGRQAEALAAYERIRSALAEELGTVPSPHLRRIHTEVLRGNAGRPFGAADRGGSGAPGPLPGPLPGLPQAPGAPAAPAHPGAPARAVPPAHPARPVTGAPPGPLTRFIGRERELDQLAGNLRESRLVTLFGPGGVGKTRLATEFAARAASGTADPVCVVELAQLSAGQDVTEAVAAAFGLHDTPLLGQPVLGRSRFDRLVASLSARRVLLVLDNCEHLVADAARLAGRLLESCPGLRLLATSREPLAVTGEVLQRVGPLQLPPSLEDAGRSTAVQLFCDRASLVQPDFALTPANTAAVVEICQQLDGLPLAIEMAAARLRSMPLQQVTARLDDRFRLLTGGSRAAGARHRTLRAMMDWSWELLTGAEQALARRLSVVGNGACLETAVAVGADPGGARAPDAGPAPDDVVYVLSSLVDKSLVQVRETASGEPRYRMPETTRAYCRDRLAEAGGTERAEAACTAHFLELAERAAEELRGPGQPRWIARLDTEHDNVLQALRRCVERRDVETAVRFGLALSWYWVMRGRYAEANTWLDELLALGDRVPEQAAAVFTAVRLVLPAPVDEDRFRGIRDAARRARDCDAMARHPLLALIEPKCWLLVGEHEQLGASARRACGHPDPWARATGRAALGFAAEAAGDVAGAERSLREALESFRGLGDQWSTSQLTGMLSRFHSLRGNSAEAIALLHEAQGAIEQVGSADDLSQIMIRLGVEQMRAGDHDAAEVSFRDALRGPHCPMPEYRVMVAAGLGELAVLRRQPSIARDRFAKAFRLLDEAVFDRDYLRLEVLCRLGSLELAEGDLKAARLAAMEALGLTVRRNDLSMQAAVAELLASVVLEEGRTEASARLLGVAAALRGTRDRGNPRVRALTRTLTERLGAEGFRREYGEGRRTRQEEGLLLMVG